MISLIQMIVERNRLCGAIIVIIFGLSSIFVPWRDEKGDVGVDFSRPGISGGMNHSPAFLCAWTLLRSSPARASASRFSSLTCMNA